MKAFPFPTKWEKPEYKEIFEKIRANGRILDIGCGRGETSYYFEECYGIDLKKQETWNEKCVVGDGYHLPFKGEQFDGVFLITSFEHFKNKDKLVREIYRVTKDDSTIIFALPTVRWKIHHFFELFKNVIRILNRYPFVDDWLIHARNVYGYNFIRELRDYTDWKNILAKWVKIERTEKTRKGLVEVYWCKKLAGV